MNLATIRVNIPIIGINQSKTKTVESTVTTIKSKQSPYNATLSFLLLPKITDNLPSKSINDLLDIPKGVSLADLKFYQSKRIDILLGVDIFWDLIFNESIEYPHLYKTQLGYVVAGQIPQHRQIYHNRVKTTCNLSTIDISNQLTRFWEIENYSQRKELSAEEQDCESYFVRTVRRRDDGRFIVSMPLKGAQDLLGESKEQAIKHFLSLEKRLRANNSLADKYINFMQQYQRLGHMTRVDDSDLNMHTTCLIME